MHSTVDTKHHCKLVRISLVSEHNIFLAEIRCRTGVSLSIAFACWVCDALQIARVIRHMAVGALSESHGSPSCA
jgi:hypothetical protein